MKVRPVMKASPRVAGWTGQRCSSAGTSRSAHYPVLNGFNAEADQRFVAVIVREGGPNWATHRELLNIAALTVDGDCRQAVSLPAAKVCTVSVSYRAPLRPSFHLRDECPGASEAQAIARCIESMQDEVRLRLSKNDKMP